MYRSELTVINKCPLAVSFQRAFALNGLGYVLIQMGRFDEAHEVLQESLSLNTQFHDRWGMGTSLGRLGLLSLQKGELANAKTLLKRSLTLFTELGMRWDIAWVLTNLGRVAIASEEWQEAEYLLRQAAKLAVVCHAMPQVIDATLELAEWYIHRGDFTRAVELIMPAIQHASSTALGKQRAKELKLKVGKKVNISDLNLESLEDVLARLI